MKKLASAVRRESAVGYLLSAICYLLPATLPAQPEPWQHPDGTFHYYHAVPVPGGIGWDAAFDSAQAPGGYLATLTSLPENDFVFSLLDSSIFWYPRPGSGRLAGPWLGGFQNYGAQEPDSGWNWITFEPFELRKWSSGEPDNNGNENALHFGESVAVRLPTWDDVSGADAAITGFVTELSADTTTLGLTRLTPNASAGYTLFSPLSSRGTYLVDHKGRLVHAWRSSSAPGYAVYLLENGLLQRCNRITNTAFPSGGGEVQRLDWNSNPVWTYQYSTTQHYQHHDALPLPSGHVLLVAWEVKSYAQSLAAGRNPALIGGRLLPDHLVEVDPLTDSIVWEWHVWDHLIQDFDSTKANFGDVAGHPELVDINFTGPGNLRTAADWLHMNSVAYNPVLDQVIVSLHNLSEIWVIDHSTTTEQARGHSGGRYGMGGDLLYRWGNPRGYRAGDSLDQMLFMQHNAQWIDADLPGAGNILVLNNGVGRGFSTADEIVPACDSAGAYPRPAPGTPFGPAAPVWSYGATPPGSLYAGIISGVQRLPSGNTQVCDGVNGVVFEVRPDSAMGWRYVNPVIDTPRLYQGDTVPLGIQSRQNAVFRAPWYPPDYPGLAGHDLTPGYPLERYGSPLLAVSEPRLAARDRKPVLTAAPNPFRDRLAMEYQIPASGHVKLVVHNLLGARVRTLEDRVQQAGSHVASWDATTDDGKEVASGIYFCRLAVGQILSTARVIVMNNGGSD
jgi:hypothetical protein